MPSAFAPIAVVLLIFIAIRYRPNKKGTPYPGPPPIPILGNVLQLPKENIWESLHKWGLKYGAQSVNFSLPEEY